MRRTLFFLSIFLLQAVFLRAQPGAGDPTGQNPTTPITGIEILLVAGGILGIKKLVSRKEKE